jgi:predicted dinucleotide-binding enzyme
MKIGVIGAGTVGQSLARGYAAHGQEVRLGTRDPEQTDPAEFRPGPPDQIADWADLIVLAVPGNATVDVASSLAKQCAGKVLVDATNALTFGADGVQLATAPGGSIGEQVQQAAPEARVVKAYNTVGANLMVDPELPGGPPTMFVAGNDADAKSVVSGLLTATGWDVVDFGDIGASRALEAIALAWVAYTRYSGRRNHAFRLLRDD